MTNSMSGREWRRRDFSTFLETKGCISSTHKLFLIIQLPSHYIPLPSSFAPSSYAGVVLKPQAAPLVVRVAP